jgi:anti-anti-sigma regulatory factor
MLKITEIERTETSVTLKLEGRIGGESVAEVKNLCEKLHSEGLALVIDLEDVSFIERGAIRFFRELKSQAGVSIKSTPFISEQLKGETK